MHPKQAAGTLGVSVKTIYRWCESGLLGQKQGGRWEISAEEMAMFRAGRNGSNGALARFAGRESEKLHDALRALLVYTRTVHQRASFNGPPDWHCADMAREEAEKALRTAGVTGLEGL